MERCEIELAGASAGRRTRGRREFDGASAPCRRVRCGCALDIRGERVGTLLLRSARPFLLSRDQRARARRAVATTPRSAWSASGSAGAQEEADALRRADRVKDALIASVSHDLRTPLTTIKGIADEIARGGDATRACVIEEEADRLSALVDDLLDLSQLAAGQMPVAPALNTADDAIGAALQRVEGAMRRAPRWTSRSARTGRCWSAGSTSRTRRASWRTCWRMRRSTRRRASPITVRAWRDAPWLCIAVEDAGGGMPAEERKRIFEPFVRGAGAERQSRGTGLGLAIARQLAEVQGGRLEFEPDDTHTVASFCAFQWPSRYRPVTTRPSVELACGPPGESTRPEESTRNPCEILVSVPLNPCAVLVGCVVA